MSLPDTKIAKLRRLWAAGDRRGALRIAARFPSLGPDKEAITRGWAALQAPSFYTQLGYDPGALVTVAFASLASRYRLT